jgi:hypothetical protein
MVGLSPRSHFVISASAILLAVVGWTQAWNRGRELEAIKGGPVANDLGRSDKAYIRNAKTGKETALLSDPRSNGLITLMAGLDEFAEPGKPNPKFIRAAETALNDSLYHRRQRDFRILLEKMRPEDAKAIHAHFKALEREGRYFGNEYAAFAMRWGQIDGEGAMASWAEFDPVDRSDANLTNLMTGWGTVEPEKALAWIKDNPDQIGNLNAYRPLLVGWINTDPVAATLWLQNQNLEPRQVAECVGGAMLDKVYSDGLEGASDWLASLPDENPAMAKAARMGWLNNTRFMGNLDAAQAAAAWSKVGSQPWMSCEDFQRFCTSVSASNGGTLDGFLEQLQTRWPIPVASAQFERWAAENPSGVWSLLTSMPPSELRRAGIETLVRKFEQTDPAQAEIWRQQLAQ